MEAVTEQQTPEISQGQTEKMFTISETALTNLINFFRKQPWDIANPFYEFIKTNVIEVKSTTDGK